MAEVPASLSTNLERTNLNISQKCGNCKHLKRIAHPAYEKVCTEHGMTADSKPCERFSADPTKISFTRDRDAFRAEKFLTELSDDKLRLFASLLVEETKTRAKGFYFGMPVYLRVYGDDYLSNYQRAKVVSADAKWVNLVSANGFTAMVLHRSVLTPAQWHKKKAWLEHNERLVDPKLHKYTKMSTAEEIRMKRLQDKLEVAEMNHKDVGKTRGRMKAVTRFTERRSDLVDMIISTR